jgi:hypothetical protein
MESIVNAAVITAYAAACGLVLHLIGHSFPKKHPRATALLLGVMIVGFLGVIYWLSDGQVNWLEQSGPESRWRAD